MLLLGLEWAKVTLISVQKKTNSQAPSPIHPLLLFPSKPALLSFAVIILSGHLIHRRDSGHHERVHRAGSGCWQGPVPLSAKGGSG